MNSTYQYYNEIVLFFRDYEVDYQNGEILIEVSEDKKPFPKVCEKIQVQLEKIAETLEPRDKDIVVKVLKGTDSKEIRLAQEPEM